MANFHMSEMFRDAHVNIHGGNITQVNGDQFIIDFDDDLEQERIEHIKQIGRQEGTSLASQSL